MVVVGVVVGVAVVMVVLLLLWPECYNSPHPMVHFQDLQIEKKGKQIDLRK